MAVPTSGFSGLHPYAQQLPHRISKGGNLHYIENAPALGPNFTYGKSFLPGHGHGRQCGQFDLNEFTQMIMKLYHDEEGDVDEAGKQSDMPTLRMVPIAASAGHSRWSRSACMGNRGGGWAMSEFGETAAAVAVAAAAREEEKVVVGLAQRID